MYNRDFNSNRNQGGNRGNYQGRRPYNSQQQEAYRPSIPDGYALYYIAAVCPEGINAEVKLLKDYMQQNFGCRAAQKSPAHITIVPPFQAIEILEGALKQFVDTFNMGLVPFEISLKGFSHFDDRVISVDVEANSTLHENEQQCNKDFSELFPAIVFKSKPEFNPHVTIATRDIPFGKFDLAWEYFATQQFNASFVCKQFQVLKLTDGKWNTMG